MKRPWLLAALLALALIGGAGRSTASTTPQCSVPDPTGRQFCVTIADQEGVSPSGTFGTGRRQTTVTAYQFYRFTIENKGGSTLTNGKMTVRLKDHVGSSDVDSTASYVAADSASFCTLVSSNPDVVSCNLGNIAAGGQLPGFSLVYRTSTTPGVVSTTLTGTVGFKEGANGPNGANPATFDVSETTSLEGDPEQSVAWAPPSAQVSLGTSPTFDSQFSTVQYAVPATKAAYLATLDEGAGSLCAAGYSCFGEVVTLHLETDGSFRFHLAVTVSLDLVPGGAVNKIVLVHLADNSSTPEVISRHCSANPPPATETLPCLTVTKDNKAGVAIIDAYGVDNGGWTPGI
jgi:hypothetical protein